MQRHEETWQRAHHEARNWLRRYPDRWTRANQDDLVQETSIAAWRWARDVRHEERFWAAVQTIATRIRGRAKRIDHRVAAQQRVVDAAVAPDDEVPERRWSIGGRSVPTQRAQPWLHAALTRLKGPDRQMLLLFHEGFCCAELAERFRCSKACVKTRLHRARHRIRREVEAIARTAGSLDT